MSLNLQAIRDRANRAAEELDGLTTGNPGKMWRWSVPANPEHDSDLIFADSTADVHTLLSEVERLNAEVDSQARQIAARSGETTGERLFKELATAKQADLTKAEARLDRVRALHEAGPVLGAWGKHHAYPDDAPACLECTDPDAGEPIMHPCPTIRALDGEATE